MRLACLGYVIHPVRSESVLREMCLELSVSQCLSCRHISSLRLLREKPWVLAVSIDEILLSTLEEEIPRDDGLVALHLRAG